MTISSMKLALGSTVLGLGLAVGGSASAGIVLPTQGLKANATLTFSLPAYGSATAARITFKSLGNMTKNGDITVVDEFGVEDVVPQWNLPVTKADVSIGWDLKIKANSGASTRSALQMTRGSKSIVVANFVVDFNKHLLTSDFITGGVTTNGGLYTFEEIVPQKISFKGLVLNQSVTIGKLILTEAAQQTLGDALALSDVLRATLKTQDWGTIAILVTSYKRSPAVSTTPFTAADIPQ